MGGAALLDKDETAGPLTVTHADVDLAWACADELPTFIKEAWPVVEPGTPLIWGWHLDSICEHLEAVTRGEITRLVMNVPPRHMKSLATSVFWPAWEWVRHPDKRFLSVSHSGPLAIRDAFKTRRLMQSTGLGLSEKDAKVWNHGTPATLLQRYGYQGLLWMIDNHWEFSGAQNLKSQYFNEREGYRISTSIGGGATGEGGDRIMIDDPHKLEEWDSVAKLEGAVEFVTEVAPSRLNSIDAAIVMIMQRIHEMDATAAVLGEVEDKPGWGDGVVHLCLPEQFEPDHPHVSPGRRKLEPIEEVTDDGDIDIREGQDIQADPRTVTGQLLWEGRFDDAGVAEHKQVGALRYSGNYQQRPAPASGNIFLKADWRYYGPGGDREDLPHVFSKVLYSWDLTFGESDDPGASWVVGQCWGWDGPTAYLLAQIRARMSFPDMKSAVPALRDYGPLDQEEIQGMIVVEEKAAGKPLLEELREIEPGLKGVSPGTSKTARAVSVQGYQEAHNLYLPRMVIPAPPGYEPTATETFVHECATFPAGADDQVDTMSQALEEGYRSKTDEVSSHSGVPGREEPVTERGGKVFRGEKFVDKPPPEGGFTH